MGCNFFSVQKRLKMTRMGAGIAADQLRLLNSTTITSSTTIARTTKSTISQRPQLI
jgi:hypothetical protein